MVTSENYNKAQTIYLSPLSVINLFWQIPETNYEGIKINEHLITLCLLLKQHSSYYSTRVPRCVTNISSASHASGSCIPDNGRHVLIDGSLLRYLTAFSCPEGFNLPAGYSLSTIGSSLRPERTEHIRIHSFEALATESKQKGIQRGIEITKHEQYYPGLGWDV